MAVLNHSNKQKIFNATLLKVMLMAIVIFSALLIAKASQLSDQSGVARAYFGPVPLFELSKVPVGNGTSTGTFQLITKGVLTYIGFWLSIGIIISAVRYKSYKM